MPDSRSEEVLQALAATLQAALPAGVSFERGAGIPARIADAGAVMLHDGDPGEPEVLLSPLSYFYTHRAEVDVLVEAPDRAHRDATFDALKRAVGAGLAGDRTLGGLCDYVEGEAPAPLELPLDGAEGLKAATIGIVLSYSTADPLG